jgi:hypothetical protein
VIPPWFGQAGAGARKVAGRVIYKEAPIDGAKVTLTSEASDAGAMPPLVVTTTKTGEFDFGDLPAASITVTATADGKTADGRFLELAEPDVSSDELELRLTDCENHVSGRVHDISGGPIAKAGVEVLFRRARVTVLANDQGEFQACVAPGAVSLLASADGYARGHESVYAYGQVKKDLPLSPEVILVGRAVAVEDQAPLAGILVEVKAADTLDQFATESSRTQTTDSDGQFRIGGLGPGRFRLMARTAGRATRHPVEVVARVGESPDSALLVLEPVVVVRGRVLAGEAPVVGATVHMQGSDLDLEYPFVVTQSDGRFVADGAPPGPTRIDVTHYRVLEPKEVTLSPASGEVVVKVEPTGTIRGRVTRLGKPVEGADVRARGDEAKRNYGGRATSKPDGSFEIQGLAPGPYQVGADASDVGAFAKGVLVTVDKAETKEGIVLELDLAGAISGVVVDEKGGPVPGALVQFSLVQGRDFGSAITADDGTFTARSMSGGGDYAASVRVTPDSPLSFQPAEKPGFPPVRLHDGNSHVEGIRLVVRYESLSIAGRVLRESGQPVSDVIVAALLPEKKSDLLPSSWFEDAVAKTRTSGDGAFTLPSLVSGSYVVRARTSGGAMTEVSNVRAGDNDLVIRFPDTGTIEGTLVGFAEKPDVEAYPGNGKRYRAVVTEGRFMIRDLPAATYVVRAAARAEGETATIEVKGGQTSRLTLTSEGRAKVTGTALDFRTRAPISGVACYWSKASKDRGERHFAASGPKDVRSDDRGRFALDVPAKKDLHINCFPRDFRNETTETASLRLEPGASQDVRVEYVTRRRETTNRAHLGLFLSPGPPITVTRVVPGGSAAEGGLAAGDVLLDVDGQATDGLEPLSVVLLMIDHPVGEPAKVTVRRGGQPKTLSIPIGPEPDWATTRRERGEH